jgi:TonB family protein
MMAPIHTQAPEGERIEVQYGEADKVPGAEQGQQDVITQSTPAAPAAPAPQTVAAAPTPAPQPEKEKATVPVPVPVQAEKKTARTAPVAKAVAKAKTTKTASSKKATIAPTPVIEEPDSKAPAVDEAQNEELVPTPIKEKAPAEADETEAQSADVQSAKEDPAPVAAVPAPTKPVQKVAEKPLEKPAPAPIAAEKPAEKPAPAPVAAAPAPVATTTANTAATSNGNGEKPNSVGGGSGGNGALGKGGATMAGAVPDSQLKQMPGNKPPQYPQRARLERREGNLELVYRVTGEGQVTDMHVTRSTGSKDLDDEAIRAIAKFKYYPGQEGWARHPVSFNLKGEITYLTSKLRAIGAQAQADE